MSYGLDLQQASQAANFNLLTNPGFEIWQRGTGFSNPAGGTYTADRWAVDKNSTPTFTFSQEGSIVDGGTYSMKINISNAAASNYLTLVQLLEAGFTISIRGKTVTMSVRVNSTSNKVRASIYDSVSRSTSAYHTGDGTWQTLVVTRTIPVNATNVNFEVGFISDNVAVCVIYVDSAMAVIGSQPAPYVPMHPSDDMARCQRYYETCPQGIILIMMQHENTGGLRVRARFASRFRAVKSLVPTLTMSNVGINLTNDPTSATTSELSDTANWTLATSPSTDGFFGSMQRTTDQAVRDVMEFASSWTAEVA